MPPDGPSTSTTAASFAGHLVAVAAALVAGIVLGGWIAFETGRWTAYKGWIEAIGDGALLLAAGLVVISVVASLVVMATTRRRTTDGRGRRVE